MKYYGCTKIYPEFYNYSDDTNIEFSYKNINYTTEITYDYKRGVWYAYIFHSGWQRTDD
jgi:hypothetical protein